MQGGAAVAIVPFNWTRTDGRAVLANAKIKTQRIPTGHGPTHHTNATLWCMGARHLGWSAVDEQWCEVVDLFAALQVCRKLIDGSVGCVVVVWLWVVDWRRQTRCSERVRGTFGLVEPVCKTSELSIETTPNRDNMPSPRTQNQRRPGKLGPCVGSSHHMRPTFPHVPTACGAHWLGNGVFFESYSPFWRHCCTPAWLPVCGRCQAAALDSGVI
jgi:hypothetical protein